MSKKENGTEFRCWMYNEDGGKLFEIGDVIPSDYVDCPTKVNAEVKPDRDALKKEATELGLEFAENIPTAKLVDLIDEAKKGS